MFKFKLSLPAPVVLVLGLLGGVLEFLNQQTFHFAAPWPGVIAYGLLIVGLLGVSPLVGKAFVTALKLPVSVSVGLTIAATALTAAITTFDISGVLKGVLLGVGPESVEDLASKAGFVRPSLTPAPSVKKAVQ